MSYLRLFSAVPAIILWSFIMAPAWHEAQAAEGTYANNLPGAYSDFASAVAPPPGVYFRNDTYFYDSENGGVNLPGDADVKGQLSSIYTINSLLAVTNRKVLGAHYAFGFAGTYAAVDSNKTLRLGSLFSAADDSKGAISDFILNPFTLYWTFGNTNVRLAEYIFVPSGAFEAARSSNPSYNYWSADTNLTLSHRKPESKWEWSANLGYVFNSPNPDTDYRTGQIFHADARINRYISDRFAVGIHGYYHHQTTPDSGSGAAVFGDFKMELGGFGLAALWVPKFANNQVSLIGKWTHDLHVENRLHGDTFSFSIAKRLGNFGFGKK